MTGDQKNTSTVIMQRLDHTTKRPYPLSHYASRLAWLAVYATLFRPSIPRAFGWRRFLLRCFGAKLAPTAAIYRSV